MTLRYIYKCLVSVYQEQIQLLSDIQGEKCAYNTIDKAKDNNWRSSLVCKYLHVELNCLFSLNKMLKFIKLPLKAISWLKRKLSIPLF